MNDKTTLFTDFHTADVNLSKNSAIFLAPEKTQEKTKHAYVCLNHIMQVCNI